MTRVTVVVPRQPGVLPQARQAARAAGVEMTAEHVGTTSITLRFSPPSTASDERTSPSGSFWARLRTRFAASS